MPVVCQPKLFLIRGFSCSSGIGNTDEELFLCRYFGTSADISAKIPVLYKTAGRSIPSFFIFDCSVVPFRPRIAAAPPLLHRPVPKGLNLDKILCIRTERTVRNDFTIAHDRKLYQIQEGVTARKVTVEEYVNGSMAILCRGLKVKFREITARPEKPRKEPSKPPPRKTLPPPKDHPWRQFHFVSKKRQSRAA
jgi:hypothetical protein